MIKVYNGVDWVEEKVGGVGEEEKEEIGIVEGGRGRLEGMEGMVRGGMVCCGVM